MADELSQSIEERLGQEFWTQPQETLSEAMQLIYSNLVAIFRDEISQRGGELVDLMLAERAAFIYSFIREREAETGPVRGLLNDRNRREMNKDLIDLLLTMKKLWSSEAKEGASEKVLAKVNKAIFSVIKELPESDGRKLQSELANAFEANGL